MEIVNISAEQVCRHLLESGPVEVISKCRGHERGEFPSRKGDLGNIHREKFDLYAGLVKCRHLRVKSMPLAFTGIFRNNPEYSGITWHFRKNNS